MTPKQTILDRFGMLFGASFLIKFRDLVNLLSGKTYNAKTSFLLIKAPPFRIICPSEFHVFSGTAPGDHFLSTHVDIPKVMIWRPLQNPMGSKTAPNINNIKPKY